MNNFIYVALGLVSQFFFVKFFIIKTVRIKTRHFEKLYKATKQYKTRKFTIKESLEDHKDTLPTIMNGFFMISGFPVFYVHHDEQMLTAGWESKRTVTEITIFRWDFSRLKAIMDNYDIEAQKTLSVYITTGSCERYLGCLNTDRNLVIDKQFNEIEKDFIEDKRTSFLLHGPPGNGKTTLIRELARKYGYDLYYVDFVESTTNTDIISLASFIPNKSIILFEDFDALYDKRKVLKFEKPNFSFDAILNLIDGVYNSNNNIIYAFSCNDIGKIDEALIKRRGRVKHILEVQNPDFQKRKAILGSEKLAFESDGMSLDGVYHLLNNHVEETTKISITEKAD